MLVALVSAALGARLVTEAVAEVLDGEGLDLQGLDLEGLDLQGLEGLDWEGLDLDGMPALPLGLPTIT